VLGSRRRFALVLAAPVLVVAAMCAGTLTALGAAPPKDCNTPNATGGIGVLETPQNTNQQGQPFLTKTLTNKTTGNGSTTYFFTLTTTRNTSNDHGSGASVTYGANTLTDTSKTWTANQWANATVVAGTSSTGTVASNTSNTLTLTAPWSSQPANGTPYTVSFFKELLDCAWDVTQGGNAATANYASQQNTATFTSGGQLGISLTVNKTDAICDRVQLKGDTPQGVPFTDYSNLVGSPAGTSCNLPSNIPEVAGTVLIGIVGGGAVGAALYVRRRRRGSGVISA
jgi:hypothetical protein